jgi:hypothetical protein
MEPQTTVNAWFCTKTGACIVAELRDKYAHARTRAEGEAEEPTRQLAHMTACLGAGLWYWRRAGDAPEF